MTRLAAVLAEHLDQPANPDGRHRLTALDPKRLRCHDCDRTILLTQPSQSTSTSQSPIPGKGEPRCATHPTEHAANCRTCAADAKAATDLDVGGRHTPELEPTADVAARAAEARALLPARTTAGPKSQSRRYDDPDRLAAARAELVQHHAQLATNAEPAPS